VKIWQVILYVKRNLPQYVVFFEAKCKTGKSGFRIEIVSLGEWDHQIRQKGKVLYDNSLLHILIMHKKMKVVSSISHNYRSFYAS